MNLPPRRSGNLSRLAQKMETQDLTLKEIEMIRMSCMKQKEHLIEFTKQLENDLGNSERTIIQFQLPLVLRFLTNSQETFYIRGLGLKMLNFFSTQFDSRPDSQEIALQIYGISPPQKEQPITEQEIKLLFRMINKYGLRGSDAFLSIVQRIQYSDQPVSVMGMIKKFNSLSLIRKLIHLDRNYQDTWTIVNIIRCHILQFGKYVNKKEQQGEDVDEQLYQEINLQFLQLSKMCVKSLEDEDIDTVATKSFLESMTLINEQIPVFKFSFQKFYLNPNLIDTQYIQLQDQIYQRLYETQLLTKLPILYDYQTCWQNHDLISVMNLMIRQINWDQFNDHFVDFLQNFLDKGTAMQQTEILSSMLIKFIYTNKQLQQSQLMFIKIFCESKIFKGINETIDKRIDKMLFTERFGTQQQKQKLNDCSNFFYLVVLAFEIIQHCQIVQRANGVTTKLMQRSVKYFKELSKIEWQGKVLDKLLLKMFEQQKQAKNFYFIRDYGKQSIKF